MTNTPILTLSKSELEELVRPSNSFGAIRDSYVAVTDGRCELPPVGYLGFPESNGDCHIKYGYISGDEVFVIKVATGFYNNPSLGLPSSNGIVLVLSARTGGVNAILADEGYLTDLRTGVGAAVATEACARSDARRIGIVGAGIQARYQALCLVELLADRQPEFAVWGRSPDKAAVLVTELQQAGLDTAQQDDLEALCRASDIVMTTTPSAEPLVRTAWIAPGTHITASGADAPGKQELEAELVARADVLVMDSSEQCLDHGEASTASARGLLSAERQRELGDVISGRAAGRIAPDQITIADLTGLGSQDIAIARTALEQHALAHA